MGTEISEKKFEKKKTLFIEQKKTLDTFLKTGAISRMQYDKSYGDLVKKMGDGERSGRTEAVKGEDRYEESNDSFG